MTLSNELSLMILGNYGISGKFQNLIKLEPGYYSRSLNENFVNSDLKLTKFTH